MRSTQVCLEIATTLPDKRLPPFQINATTLSDVSCQMPDGHSVSCQMSDGHSVSCQMSDGHSVRCQKQTSSAFRCQKNTLSAFRKTPFQLSAVRFLHNFAVEKTRYYALSAIFSQIIGRIYYIDRDCL